MPENTSTISRNGRLWRLWLIVAALVVAGALVIGGAFARDALHDLRTATDTGRYEAVRQLSEQHQAIIAALEKLVCVNALPMEDRLDAVRSGDICAYSGMLGRARPGKR